MIPVRLILSNFMSYAEGSPAIDFTTFTIACLSGENGHGKSTLLDGITWALWGEARAHADSLIRLGSTSMSVDFEFDVDDKRFRVIRKRSLARTGSTHTELQTVTEEGAYRSITGTGERDTQDKINRILRMDYRAFINSAFILQGRADEFTTRKATERKEILADIMDLQRYDTLETMAREKMRAAEEAGRAISAELDALLAEIARKPMYQAALDQAQNELTQAENLRDVCEANLSALKAELTGLGAQSAALDALRAQAEKAAHRSDEAQSRAVSYRQRLAKLETILSQREEIESRLRQREEVRQELEHMDEAHRAYLAAEREENQVQAALREKRHALEIRAASAKQKAADLARRAGEKDRIHGSLERLRRAHRSPATVEAQLDSLREKRDQHQQQAQAAELSAPITQRQIDELEQRQTLLRKPGAECPLCQSPLSPHDHQRLAEQLIQEKDLLTGQLVTLRQEKEEAEARMKEVLSEARTVKKELDASRTAEREMAGLESALADAVEAGNWLPPAEADLSALQQELAGPIDPELASRLKAVQTARQASAYDERQHTSLRSQLRQLDGAERDHQNLEHAVQDRLETVQRLDETEELARAYDIEVQRLQEQMAPMASIPERKREVDALANAAVKERDALIRTASSAREQCGRQAERLTICAAQEEQAGSRREDLKVANKDAAIYKELAAAFSKKGIQAMIIENVIPEIEEEANRLLARMADNGMHIQFRTQRELKRGGGAETLDIIIGDEMGDRAYECYSGGEAFRINFSIRIALSRLLARRAGARLQTIVIDEGFGSQDANGRKRVVEAIQSIKDEFARIIVITHLDEMKDEFPTRLHVIKDDKGSRVVNLTR